MKHSPSGRLWRVSAVITAAVTLLATAATQATAAATASAVVPAASTAGCGMAPTLSSGTHTITSSGKSRSYILTLPANYDRNHSYRLVFGLHWLGGNAEDVVTGRTVLTGVWAYYGLQQLSDNSTIFVAPQGLNNGWANPGGQDVTLIDDVLKQIEGGLCVDTTRVFSVGFSYGAAMTYALACARPTVFRAVALYSGGLLSGCSGGTQPVAYLASHGVSDPVLSISGGRSLRDRFVKNNKCTPQNPPEPAKGSRTHIATTYTGCSAGHPVEWVAFDGGHDACPADGV
ncbi:PHB depolymerase family esterase [Kutzneria sp. 744]|uniref:alpha/beta hydrolase family esterase n=1 Tax=Kutzneria sp. (strain 744) TaxID=345341 RepID=UPI0004B9BB96